MPRSRYELDSYSMSEIRCYRSNIGQSVYTVTVLTAHIAAADTITTSALNLEDNYRRL